MPELPEVQGLTVFLGERLVGSEITHANVTSFSALKTFDPPIDALTGAKVTAVARHGKFVSLRCSGNQFLIFHLAKAGWLRWYDALPATMIKLGKSPIALRMGFDDGSGFDLTEAGTKKSLAAYVVRDPSEVPGIARLGPDPFDAGFTRESFAVIAGIGNAYSDEILHAARMSPYAIAAGLEDDDIERLYEAMQTTLQKAVIEASGKPPAKLKDAKRGGMRVHARRGEKCPVCNDTVRSVFFADRSMEYCATCQTGGKVLADRRLSRLLK